VREETSQRRSSKEQKGRKSRTRLEVVDLSEDVAEEVLLLGSSSKKSFVRSGSGELSVDGSCGHGWRRKREQTKLSRERAKRVERSRLTSRSSECYRLRDIVRVDLEDHRLR